MEYDPSSEVTLPDAIHLRALCGAVTCKLTRESRVGEPLELHRLVGRYHTVDYHATLEKGVFSM